VIELIFILLRLMQL